MPLFFVVLGPRLDLRGVLEHPAMLGLALALASLTVIVHLLAAVTTHQPPVAGLLASAQLGRPARDAEHLGRETLRAADRGDHEPGAEASDQQAGARALRDPRKPEDDD